MTIKEIRSLILEYGRSEFDNGMTMNFGDITDKSPEILSKILEAIQQYKEQK